jgi:hypothetical protein
MEVINDSPQRGVTENSAHFTSLPIAKLKISGLLPHSLPLSYIREFLVPD